MSRTHNILEIPMGDFEFEGVKVNGEWLKRLIMSLLNKVTFSVRWRGRGKRKVHAIANGYSARGYDQDLPLEFAERQVLYINAKPTKVDREAQKLKEANWKIDSCKYQMDRLSDQEVEAEDRLELIREDREIALAELKEAIQKRNKLTKTVKEV
tara:strand:+ start:240 stop:701 length:462 start_codon:yes stop_codon:yes gene_type:complete